MNEEKILTTNKLEERITPFIYQIRGKLVMLDSDLGQLYNCSNGTKTINQAVNRNIERFPEDFYFQLTNEEFDNIWQFKVGNLKPDLDLNLKSQIGTSSLNHGGRRKLPYVFTEQGIMMLATILRTKVASSVSISIMRAFVIMHNIIKQDNNLLNNYNEMLIKHDNLISKNTNDIKLLQESFDKLNKKQEINQIYFKGQTYDAYSKIVDIFKEAKKELIIIDGYADKSILDMIKELNVKVYLIVKNKSLISTLDIQKYNSQYQNLTLIHNDSFHDRYFIIDRKIVNTLGASINHAGSKTFSINLLEDKIVSKSLTCEISKIMSSFKYFCTFIKFIHIQILEKHVAILPHLSISRFKGIPYRSAGQNLDIIRKGVVNLIYSNFLF